MHVSSSLTFSFICKCGLLLSTYSRRLAILKLIYDSCSDSIYHISCVHNLSYYYNRRLVFTVVCTHVCSPKKPHPVMFAKDARSTGRCHSHKRHQHNSNLIMLHARCNTSAAHAPPHSHRLCMQLPSRTGRRQKLVTRWEYSSCLHHAIIITERAGLSSLLHTVACSASTLITKPMT